MRPNHIYSNIKCKKSAQISVIYLYSFPIELKPKIVKIQICETVKITEMIFSLGEIINFVTFTVYYISLRNLNISRKAYKKIDKFLSFNVIYKIHIQTVEVQKASGVIIYNFDSYGKFDLRLLLCLMQLQKYRDTYHIALPVSWDDTRIVPPYFRAWCIFSWPARKIPGIWSPCQTDSQLQESSI